MTKDWIVGRGPGWIAIDKPAGISVHNDPRDALTLVRELLEGDSELARATAWKGEAPSPAHRLDRETSGVLLLALSKNSARTLQTAFAEKHAEKFYRAVLRGSLKRQEGVWENPLSDKAEGRKNPAGLAKDRVACTTAFKVSKSNPYLTEVEIDLGTGRQHQIRRHAVLARHEVLNDARYGDPRFMKMIASRYGVTRMMLHAESLRLTDVGVTIDVRAPVPDDFARLFETSGDEAEKIP